MLHAEFNDDRERWIIGLDQLGESLRAKLPETENDQRLCNGIQGTSESCINRLGGNMRDNKTRYKKIYYDSQTSEGEMWPPLKKLDISDNAIRYLSAMLVGRWDKLEELDLMNNEWSCDCNNQFLVSCGNHEEAARNRTHNR